MATNKAGSQGLQAALHSERHGVSSTERATAKSTTSCEQSVSRRSAVDKRSSTSLANATE
jgi:hypothetical protein